MTSSPRPNPISARRRQMREVVATIGAILFALLGQARLEAHAQGKPVDLLTVFGFFGVAVSLLFSYSAAEPLLPKPILPVDPNEASPRNLFSRPLPRRVLVLAVLVNLSALGLFGAGIHLNLAWLLYTASVLLAIFAAARASTGPLLVMRRPRFELLGLGIIFLVALAFRTYQLGSYPAGLWFDEAQQGLEVLRILHDPSYRPVWLTGLPPGPALIMYAHVPFFLVFGASKLAIRLVPTVAGLIGVVSAYLLTRELFGWRTGLVAAALLAVETWNVNFSRIDFTSIWAVGLNALAAYFLLRGLRTRQALNYVLAGVVLGLGVNSYYTSYLYGIALFVFLGYRLLTDERARWRSGVVGLILFLIATGLTASPVAEFAVLHHDQYAVRMHQVSIVNEIASQHSLEPIQHSLIAHVLMFNYEGDHNGRHNLSGFPQLDAMTAALFILGLVLCVRFWRRASFLFPLLVLLAILPAGVLSVSFEAPQSLRTIDNSLTCTILAALPLSFLWTRMAELRLGRVNWRFGRVGTLSLSSGALIVLALRIWIGMRNFDRYFVRQANDPTSYSAFSTAPTLVAETLNRLGPDYQAYLSPTLINQPTISFLYPQIGREVPFDPALTLPLRDTKNVVVFLEDRDAQYFDALRRLYPAATFEERRLRPDTPVVLYTAIIPHAQVAALHGLDATYQQGTSSDGPTIIHQIDPSIAFDWRQRAPAAFPFVVHWQGSLFAPSYGQYRIRFDGPPDVTIAVDGNPALKHPGAFDQPLATGLHTIEVTAVLTGPSAVQLWWTPPGQPEQLIPNADLFHAPAMPRGLLGTFYANLNWQGRPVLQNIDLSPSQYFHLLPVPQPFSVEWTGKVLAPRAGLYHFGTQSIDASWLSIDGQSLVDNSRARDQYVDGSINLTPGLHDIRLRYVSESGYSYVNVYWQPPGEQRALIPATYLIPPQKVYPDSTTLLQQTLAAAPPPRLAPANPSVEIPAGAIPNQPLPVERITRIRTVGASDNGADQLSQPHGIAVDPLGNIFVADSGHQRVVEYDAKGAFVRAFGSANGTDALQDPVAVVVSPNGRLAVLDATAGWIDVFRMDGKLVQQFGGPKAGMYHPRGLAVSRDGTYYVADTGSARVAVFNQDGTLERSLRDATSPAGASHLQPDGIAVDAQQTLYLTDAGSYQVLHRDRNFSPLQSWTIARFDSTNGAQVAAGLDGSAYLSDPANHRVLHIGPQGQLRQFPETFALPLGVAVGSDGKVYVVDGQADRVYVYANP